MARILVISFSDLRRDPRVRRQIEALREAHAVMAAGAGDPALQGVQFVSCSRPERTFTRKYAEAVELLVRRYEAHYWSLPHVKELHRKLRGAAFDLVIANDIEALPIALRLAHGRPVVLDAHEYAPRELEDSLVWRLTRQGYAYHLCSHYLRQAAAMITVCGGIAEEYERQFGVSPVVIDNAAPFYNLAVQRTRSSDLRMIHHGAAIPSRRIELMVALMAYLDPRFSLDLILVPGDLHYIEQLRRRAAGQGKIRFLAPVPMDELVAVSSQYDIGLFLLPPTNFNYRMALPNKFFEFVQARLAVAIGPSPEMVRLVSQHGCGVVAPDFSPQSLAHLLNGLTAEDVDRMKQGADRAAAVHNAERNAARLRELVASVLRG